MNKNEKRAFALSIIPSMLITLVLGYLTIVETPWYVDMPDDQAMVLIALVINLLITTWLLFWYWQFFFSAIVLHKLAFIPASAVMTIFIYFMSSQSGYPGEPKLLSLLGATIIFLIIFIMLHGIFALIFDIIKDRYIAIKSKN